ncbi:cytochrome P450, family 82, subfamily C, polypeptide 3 [Actinidia rufa]|uniref:Cytochrome P450, family 82, subfamily C, polypeptide 3 n=1 Tax=Actinidia rufa TaxID=165716 RepID=A0A7J0DE80_9ERIC|nr:cytochrome P450, family 82, subfamily C, polypeptide 3 [Actinidia rufa]
MDSCTVAGYNVPDGTYLIVNIWKIQRDPRIWINPSAFKPERFALRVGQAVLPGCVVCSSIPSPDPCPSPSRVQFGKPAGFAGGYE